MYFEERKWSAMMGSKQGEEKGNKGEAYFPENLILVLRGLLLPSSSDCLPSRRSVALSS